MNKNRLCFCVFWDKKGILRDFSFYYIKALKEITKKLIVIINGDISEKSKHKLSELNIDIIQRENFGLDFGGWKYAIEKIGYRTQRSSNGIRHR